MTTYYQDVAFATEIVEYKQLLDRAIAWISANLEPEDVFSENHLASWAEDMGYKKAT